MRLLHIVHELHTLELFVWVQLSQAAAIGRTFASVENKGESIQIRPCRAVCKVTFQPVFQSVHLLWSRSGAILRLRHLELTPEAHERDEGDAVVSKITASRFI